MSSLSSEPGALWQAACRGGRLDDLAAGSWWFRRALAADRQGRSSEAMRAEPAARRASPRIIRRFTPAWRAAPKRRAQATTISSRLGPGSATRRPSQPKPRASATKSSPGSAVPCTVSPAAKPNAGANSCRAAQRPLARIRKAIGRRHRARRQAAAAGSDRVSLIGALSCKRDQTTVSRHRPRIGTAFFGKAAREGASGTAAARATTQCSIEIRAIRLDFPQPE
ncbi:hypothetical protein BurGSRB05_34505 [Burkholderia gladioli]|nr:hypothetical protein [Burkholderia gladioli]